MKKLTFLLILLCSLATTMTVWADTAVLNRCGSQVSSIQSGSYYVIAGYAQNASTTNFLYDNGVSVKATTLTTGSTAGNLFVWQLTGNATDGYVMTNFGTGNKVSLGSSNNSTISTGSTSQNLAITFDSDNYAMIYNTSSNQAIDVGWAGTSPTTWTAPRACQVRAVCSSTKPTWHTAK